MRSIIKSALFILIIIMTVKCDEQISSNSNDQQITSKKKIYTLTGTVYDRMIDDTSPNPMIGVKVYLGNDSTFTDIYGNFKFVKEEGTYALKINSPNFIPYSETINLEKDA